MGEVRSSTLVSTAHRKSRRDWFLDNGKKGEASFGRLLLHKSENRFLRLLLPCLVRLGSSPHSALLLSSSISVQFSNILPLQNEILPKLLVETPIRVE